MPFYFHSNQHTILPNIQMCIPSKIIYNESLMPGIKNYNSNVIAIISKIIVQCSLSKKGVVVRETDIALDITESIHIY